MSVSTTVDVLNRLLALHSRSLPSYLASARPWFADNEQQAMTVLRHIAEDQELMVERLGTLIVDVGAVPAMGEFPMTFTDMHDLSMDYILPRLIEWVESDIDSIRQCVAALDGEPEAQALAEEALGAAQAHLDSLNELRQPSSN